MPAYKPTPTHDTLGETFYSAVEPAEFPKHILRLRNNLHAETVGLAGLSDEEWVSHFGKCQPLQDNFEKPLALAYHGHQFRTYNPDLGDGRGFLFAQMQDDKGRLLDLGTKGSGTTPWSRGADGRLTLKGAVREILATEMLDALGVNSSKTFSVVETGEDLMRGDEPSPTRSAVLFRLSHSHIRIGTFQRLAAHKEQDEIEKLLRYAATHYFDELSENLPVNHLALGFLQGVVKRTTETLAGWMAAGFVHGVLNTDNINITGESFDYGPWRFLPIADPSFTAAYFDQTSLYAYGRQPETIFWNLCRLAECLLEFVSTTDLEAVLHPFENLYRDALNRAFARRLGITEEDATSLDLGRNLFPAMAESGVHFEEFFFNHYGGKESRKSEPVEAKLLGTYASAIKGFAPAPDARPDHAYFAGDAPETILIGEVEALWSHIDERDDWQPLLDKIADIRAMGEIHRRPAQ